MQTQPTPPPAAGDAGATLTAGAGSGGKTPSDRPVEQRVYLRELVGRGGCGEVYEAIQSSLGRIIAVKCIRGDLLSSSDRPYLEEEFQREAFITARLDHPNIIPVYDLTLGDDGQPLLAMKLARGTPWNRMIADDWQALSAEDFLGRQLPVLISVCQAVAFAHSRGIVHRDLKPSQVIVGEYGEVLLMDWGLAVYLGAAGDHQRPSASTIESRLPTGDSASSPAGTPAYMAPEQTEHTARNIGPWTDVYLLGGILYSLLTGHPPHNAPTSQEAFDRARRGIIDPVESQAAGREVPAELAAIAMKALEAIPANRTASAGEFVRQLLDYQSGATRRRESIALSGEAQRRLEPAVADYTELNEVQHLLDRAAQLWPGNPEHRRLGDRLHERFARTALRHGDLTLAGLQAGMLHDAGRRGALAAEVAAAFEQRARAARQRRVLLGVSAVLGTVVLVAAFLLQSNVSQRRIAESEAAHQASLAQIFQDVNELRRAEGELAREIASAIPLPRELALDDSARQQGATPGAGSAAVLLLRRDELRAKRSALRGSLGDRLEAEPVELLLADANLMLDSAVTTDDYLEAFERYEEATQLAPGLDAPWIGAGIAAARAGYLTTATLALSQARGNVLTVKGPAHPDNAMVLALQAEANLALDNESDDFVTYYRESLKVLEPRWMELSSTIGRRLDDLDLLDEAVKFTSPALELALKSFPPGSPELIPYIEKQGRVTYRLGDRDGGAGYYQWALDLARQAHGESSAEAANFLSYLGSAAADAGDFEEAFDYFGRSLAINEAIHGPDHPRVAGDLSNLGTAKREAGKFQEALELSLRALAIREAAFGLNHPTTASAYNDVALCWKAVGEFAKAVEVMRKSLGVTERAYGRRHPKTAFNLHNLAAQLRALGRSAEAIELQREAVSIGREFYTEDDLPFLNLQYQLGDLLRTSGRPDLAEPHIRAVLEGHLRTLGDSHWMTAVDHSRYALVQYAMNRFDTAEEYMLKGIEIFHRALGPNHPHLATAYTELSSCQRILGKFDESVASAMRAGSIAARAFPRNHPYHQVYLSNIGEALAQRGDKERGLPYSILAIRRAVDAYGLSHPTPAGEFNDFALSLSLLGRPRESMALSTAAHAIYMSLDGGGEAWDRNPGLHTLAESLSYPPYVTEHPNAAASVWNQLEGGEPEAGGGDSPRKRAAGVVNIVNFGRLMRGFVARAELLEAQPDKRRDLQGVLLLRAAAIEKVLGGLEYVEFDEEKYRAAVRRLGIEEQIAALPEPPADLEPASPFVYDRVPFYAWLDQIGEMPSTKALFGDQLPPVSEALAPLMAGARERALEVLANLEAEFAAEIAAAEVEYYGPPPEAAP